MKNTMEMVLAYINAVTPSLKEKNIQRKIASRPSEHEKYSKPFPNSQVTHLVDLPLSH